MTRTQLRLMVASLLLAPVLVGCVSPRRVNTRTLLGEMTDLAALAERPQPSFTTRQFSSYDRKSTTPEDPETWFANLDAGEYLRTEEHDGRTEYVMMDADGPGAIVRIWSANPRGTLRFYLDRAEQPTLEVPMADLLGGQAAGFPEPLAGRRGMGWNLYFPIPYTRHCKVTNDDLVGQQHRVYYHINYRTYPLGARVETFKPKDLEELVDEISRVAASLSHPRLAAGPSADAKSDRTLSTAVDLRAGEAVVLQELRTSDGAAITDLRFLCSPDDLPEALREILLTIEFDGQATVRCPLGDFFGTVPGTNAYESLPLGVTPAGVMWSHWIMPYQKSAVIKVHNTSSQTVRLAHAVTVTPHKWARDTMYFNARWKIARNVPTRPFSDWNYVTIDGAGVFVGAACSIANPVRAWWGEGDEKIYVDNEEFPSHFGTGTEDYFGYAWCSNQTFSHAYHNQPRCDGPWNYGWTAVNRWDILDCIPFHKHFRLDMEIWHWDPQQPIREIAAATYWYARPGATCEHEELTDSDLSLTNLPPYEPPRIAGAIEAEALAHEVSAGVVEQQTIMGCSDDQHLWWHNAGPEASMKLTFAAPAASSYQVFARFVRAADYGQIRVSVNDEVRPEPLDLYHDRVRVSDEDLLGVFNLKATDNVLLIEITGANPQAIPGYMVGIDYLRLVPVE